MNKHVEQPLDITQPAELHVDLGFQAAPFVVTGELASLKEVMAITEAEDARLGARRQKVLAHVAKPAVEAAAKPVEATGLGRIAVDLKTKLYDARFGTDFYSALQDKRNTERDLRFAGSLGLLTEDVCAKHRKALAAVRSVR